MVGIPTVGCSDTNSHTVFQLAVLATGAGGAQRSEWRIQNGAPGNAWTVAVPSPATTSGLLRPSQRLIPIYNYVRYACGRLMQS